MISAQVLDWLFSAFLTISLIVSSRLSTRIRFPLLLNIPLEQVRIIFDKLGKLVSKFASFIPMISFT